MMIEDWYISDRLKIRYMLSPSSSPSSRVLLWFPGTGGALGNKTKPTAFFESLNIDSIIWAQEREPFSWGNTVDIENLCSILGGLIKNKELLVFGNSMGGFLSILLSKHLKPTKVLAVNPQYSVHPDIIPEKRWSKYVKAITEFKYKDLSNSFMPNIDYAVMFGEDEQDQMHFDLFERHSASPNVQNIKFLDYKSENGEPIHEAGKYLGKLNLFRPTMSRFYNGQSLKELYAKKSINTIGVKY